MPALQKMPEIHLDEEELKQLGLRWEPTSKSLPKADGEKAGKLCDSNIAKAMAKMLGDIEIKSPLSSKALIPPHEDCVELGSTTIIGGIRSQMFDICYRPDGVRIAYDNKSLNSKSSVGKNYRNMINDLGTEAATVHSRFPFAVVSFVVILPEPCLEEPHLTGLMSALVRLNNRSSENDHAHKAEVISLVLWDPTSGKINKNYPKKDTGLHLSSYSEKIYENYFLRYRGMAPHLDTEIQEEEVS